MRFEIRLFSVRTIIRQTIHSKLWVISLLLSKASSWQDLSCSHPQQLLVILRRRLEHQDGSDMSESPTVVDAERILDMCSFIFILYYEEAEHYYRQQQSSWALSAKELFLNSFFQEPSFACIYSKWIWMNTILTIF